MANPVITPRPDVEIPAVKLSATGNALDMLNKDFLDAIAPAPAEVSTDPITVLKELITSLAADATYLGKSAIVAAFFAGANAATQPELTATAHTYLQPERNPLTAPHVEEIEVPAALTTTSAAAVFPAHDTASTAQVLSGTAIPAEIPAELSSFVSEIVTAVVKDVSDPNGGGLIDAAFAVGAILAVEGVKVIASIGGLVGHGVRVALEIAGAMAAAATTPDGDILTAIQGATQEQPVVSAPTAPPAAELPTPPPAPLVPTRGAERSRSAPSPLAATSEAGDQQAPSQERSQRHKVSVGAATVTAVTPRSAASVPAPEPAPSATPPADLPSASASSGSEKTAPAETTPAETTPATNAPAATAPSATNTGPSADASVAAASKPSGVHRSGDAARKGPARGARTHANTAGD